MGDRSFDQLHLGRTAADGAGKACIRDHDAGSRHARHGPGVVDDEDQHRSLPFSQGLEGESPGIVLGVFWKCHPENCNGLTGRGVCCASLRPRSRLISSSVVGYGYGDGDGNGCINLPS